MLKPESRPCDHCSYSERLSFNFTFAFQPIVDVRAEQIYSYEALVRGTNGESAGWVLERVNADNRYRFDQACRMQAIELATRLGMRTHLNINFMPNAIYEPENCIRSTFAAAEKYGFPIEQIIFECLESEELRETSRLAHIMSEYKRFGFLTAIDDFGSGFRELTALASFQPDIIKIDMLLLRDVDRDPARRAIVRGLVQMCRELGIRVLAEGVETCAEYRWLAGIGIDLFQGYFFAKPAFEALPTVRFDLLRTPVDEPLVS